MGLAAAVRAGALDPVRVVRDALGVIERLDGGVGAFRRVRAAEAVAEARTLATRDDLGELPLAGVPVAVADVLPVAGEYAGWGSRAGRRDPAARDGDVVARLRAAGAVVVGLARTSELAVWPTTDAPDAITRNPWAPAYSAGGSSGGSAAAVAAGMVPCAHATDALGALRSPAAACGLVGVTPGTGTVPAADSADWYGMYVHGPLATTVADAALLLSVLAERPALADVRPPNRPLRIALSTRPPTGRRPPADFAAAATHVGDALRAAGHHVEEAVPDYGTGALAIPQVTRWLAGPVQQAGRAGPFERRLLQRRTRAHLRMGRLVRRAGLVDEAPRRAWAARAEAFFARYDVLLTPALATPPARAEPWHRRSWQANALPASRLGAFLGPWNLAGFPCLTLPAPHRRSPGTPFPLAVQLVTPPRTEARLLSVAAQIESLRPWPRTAPPLTAP